MSSEPKQPGSRNTARRHPGGSAHNWEGSSFAEREQR
jgi:hypothetical protein